MCAAVAAIEAKLVLDKTSQGRDLSEQQMIDCISVDPAYASQGCRGGYLGGHAFAELQSLGLPLDSHMQSCTAPVQLLACRAQHCLSIAVMLSGQRPGCLANITFYAPPTLQRTCSNMSAPVMPCARKHTRTLAHNSSAGRRKSARQSPSPWTQSRGMIRSLAII